MTHSDDIAFPARLTIDLAAIADNWRRLAAMGEDAECGAVVKADAYGLGAAEVAPVLRAAGCRVFFVAFAGEGAALRAILGPEPEIYVMCASQWDDPAQYRAKRLIPVVSTAVQFNHFAAQQNRGETSVMLQVETGMNRLGLSLAELEACLSRAVADAVPLAGVMSHLACADMPDDPHNRGQLDRFREAAAVARTHDARLPRSLANSSGLFLGSDWHFDLLRPGAALYGVNPRPGLANPMRHVVRLEAPFLQVKAVEPGEAVGYGASLTVTETRRIAVVAAGYADGLHRALSNRGHAVVAGRRVPYAGRVSMDLIALDVTDVPEDDLAASPKAELIGPDMTIDEVAAAAATIGYEILTHLGDRFDRLCLPSGGQD